MLTALRRRHPRRPSLRLLAAAIAFAIVIAAPVGEALASVEADGHAAVCKCGPQCRRGACCCGPKRSRKAEQAPATPSDLVAAERGPCLGAAPIGDDAAPPTRTAAAEIDETASLAREIRLSLRRGDRLPPPTSELADGLDASRVDRPPRANLPVRASRPGPFHAR